MQAFLSFNYNLIIVLCGTMLLGLTCGVLGVFMLLRKRALMSDAISHATLPGITIAYLIVVLALKHERSLFGIIVGALISGAVCIFFFVYLKRRSGLKDDALIAIILSSFFGLGIAFLGIIQKLPSGHAAGLQRYIYGDTASMLQSDVILISITACAILLFTILLFKEFLIITFDELYAAAVGYRVQRLDSVLLIGIVFLTVIGIQAAGLILIIALFIIPALTAKFWTVRMHFHCVWAAVFGASSAFVGTLISTVVPNIPTGAGIVLVAGLFFGISLLFGLQNGILFGIIARFKRNIRFICYQLLLTIRFHFNVREFFQVENKMQYINLHGDFTFHWLSDRMRISHRKLKLALRIAIKNRNFTQTDRYSYKITADGVRELLKVMQNHEIYHVISKQFTNQIHDLDAYDEMRIIDFVDTKERAIIDAHFKAHHPYLLYDFNLYGADML